ncbi:Chemotactic transducer-related protein [hydrothermal vent metagenome]|uniref:Chemotactic transducer-related protein n=1 Tax=hydrothermal vent metagenome TaxID=652676 RepID=A0A3B1BM52_9ZZZZ
MANLIIKSGKNLGCLFRISDEVTVGRAHGDTRQAGSQIFIEDENISRDHLHIFMNGNGYCVEDLGSTNGSCLGNTPLNCGQVYPLHDGEVIRLGDTQLLFANFDADILMNRDMQSEETLEIPFHFSDDMPTLEVVADIELQQDVSMMVDASQLIQELHNRPATELLKNEELVKRMQAMVQVSMALGATTRLEDLMTCITEQIFDLFAEAERAFVMLYEQKKAHLVPLSVRYRDKPEMTNKKIGISHSIIKNVIENKQAILIDDAQGDLQYGQQESVMNLAIRSVMCVPILFQNQVLGLVQVDNRGGSKAFSADELQILAAVCSQLAISLRNSQLYEEIESLFEGFVKASVQAIESRDPGTAGHSFRVADYAEKLAIAVDRSADTDLKLISFNQEQIKELRYASLLHDFGKVGVREHVLTKARKLYPHELDNLKLRVHYAEACMQERAYRGLVERHILEKFSAEKFEKEKRKLEQQLIQERTHLRRFVDMVLELNEPGCQRDELIEGLADYKGFQFDTIYHQSQLLMEPFEFSALTDSRGTLNVAERKEIETHVTHTFIFLSLIPWTSRLNGIPDIAYAHHERMDGSGYPRGLANEEIPLPAKIMAIVDIYDALTAGDRPYRQGLNNERALEIIESEVKIGKLDENLFRVFIESSAYQH